MNYLEHTTIYKASNGTEYKKIRLQEYKEGHHKATNKFYINGKQVRNHERWVCEDTLDNTHPRDCVSTEKKWTK